MRWAFRRTQLVGSLTVMRAELAISRVGLNAGRTNMSRTKSAIRPGGRPRLGITFCDQSCSWLMRADPLGPRRQPARQQDP